MLQRCFSGVEWRYGYGQDVCQRILLTKKLNQVRAKPCTTIHNIYYYGLVFVYVITFIRSYSSKGMYLHIYIRTLQMGINKTASSIQTIH